MTDTARLRTERHGAVLHVVLEHAPVNSLSHPMRVALWEAIEAADADVAAQAIVLAGAGRGFSAGGDYSELDSPMQQAWPALSNHLFPRIEACKKPVVAALHGFAIGGGFELALACHYRVAQRNARIALPEMKHGVVPPSGSQRLPRAVGVARTLDLIFAFEPALAVAYADTPLFDHLCEGSSDRDVIAAAHDFATGLDPTHTASTALLRCRPLDRRDAAEAIRAWRERIESRPDVGPAMRGCIDAVECAVTAPTFDAGLAAAKRLHDELAALKHTARASQETR